MEIRATAKDYKRFQRHRLPEGVSLTKDEKISTSVIMIQTEDGELIPWSEGRNHILSYLKRGYVRIQKQCPYRHRKCIAEKCSLYFIKNGTGDCAHVWSVI